MNYTHLVNFQHAGSAVNKCNHMNTKLYSFGMKVTTLCPLIKLNEDVVCFWELRDLPPSATKFFLA